MRGQTNLSICLFVLGIAVLYNSALAQWVETPNKWFAPRGSEAQIPCISNADDLKFRYNNRDASRIHIFEEAGDPNLMILSIEDVVPSDTGTYTCMAAGITSAVDLIVYEPSPPIVAVGVTPSNNVKLTWTPPTGPRDAMTRYKIYVKEVTDQVGVATFEVMDNPNSEEQHFLLEDLKPGATYDIQVSAFYIQGADDEPTALEGPRSAKVRIDTPHFNSPPVMVKASPWKSSSILVTWKKPTNLEENAVDGYTVVYKAVPMKRNSPKGELNVTSRGDSNQWRAILEGLPVKTRYEIAVYAIQNGVYGKKSQTVLFRHEGFAPELSIRAFPLSPDTALVSVSVIGGDGDIRKLRVLWSDDSATKWTRINGCAVDNHCLVTGLKPESKYYFVARARVSGRSRNVVTHITTLPLDLVTPLDLAVKALTDHSITASWLYPNKKQPIGFILTVEVKETDDQEFRPFKQEVVYGTQTARVDGLRSYEQYRVRVAAFNVDGKGNPSESVLFTISADAVDRTTEAPLHNPPRFIQIPSTFMQIDAGENATLTCIAIGDPNPMVQWTSNGSVISYPRDRTNVLNLYNLRDSMVATCKAENDYGKIFHEVRVDVSHGLGTFPTTTVTTTTTTTTSKPVRQYEAPSLANELPKTLVRPMGVPINLRCRFNGFPLPIVTWYENNRPIGRESLGESVLAIPSLQSSSELSCVGRNAHGRERHVVRLVLLETTTRPIPTTTGIPAPAFGRPVLVDELPAKIQRKQGEPLHVMCRFNGNPPPIVTWYQNNRPIGEGSQWESILHIPSVKHSSSLMCEGRNHQGVERHPIKLVVTRPEVEQQKLQDYKVSLRFIRTTRDSAIVKWVIDEGDIPAIRHFNVTIQAVQFPVTVMKDIVAHDTRHLTLNRLLSDVTYHMRVETATRLGIVNVATMDFQLPQNEPLSGKPLVLLEAVEIRHDSARIDFTSMTQVRRFRLQVKDLDARHTLGNTIMDTTLPANAPSINLQRLKPTREYQVILDAYPRRGDVVSSRVKFMTPQRGQAGISVASRSDEQPATTTERIVVTTATTPPQTTTVTSTTTTPTTTPMTTTTLKPIKETTTEQPDDGYELKVKTTYRTSSQVDIRWSVNRGDLAAIDHFLFSIKGSNGFTLLKQELNRQQRSITIQSLIPATRYFVEVKVRRRNKDVLQESGIVVVTLSKDAIRDNRNAFINLEANEIRDTSARIVWSIGNGDPSSVSAYVLKVLNRDANGVNLLTQNMSSNSQSLNLRALPANRRFYVIVDALDRRGNVNMSSSLTFTTAKPGGYGIPARSSRNPAGLPAPPGPPAPLRLAPTTPSPNPVSESFLLVDIVPSPPYGARLTFSQKSEIPVKEFKVIARTGGSHGPIYLTKYLPIGTKSYVVRGMHPELVYYLEVEMLDNLGKTLARVVTSYRLPPPGHHVEAIRVASNETDNTRASDNENPVIVDITRLNDTSAIVMWQNSPSVSPKDSVMIRYSKYRGRVKDSHSSRITYTRAMTGKLALLDLEEGTTYGFQIAKAEEALEWSPLFFYNS